MALEQQIRDALLQLAATLQQDVTTRANAIATELARATEEDRMAAEADSMSKMAAELAAVRAEAERRIETETARVRAEVGEKAAADLAAVQADLQRAREQAEGLRQEVDRFREQLESAVSELALVRDRATGAEHALEEARASASIARVEEREGELAELDGLLEGIRQIGGASTLSDVLNALADAVTRETPRTAIFVVSGDGYQPFRVHGFEGVEASALSPSQTARLGEGLPFAPLPQGRAGHAIPIDVGGQQVALVYADDAGIGEARVPSVWPEAVEILARHAALRLESLTATRAVQALHRRQATGAVATVGTLAGTPPPRTSTTGDDQSARRYARLLVSEIKLYNEAAVRLGRQNRDLFDRLRPEIERARRLYEERVPAHVPARGAYFDDELVQTLADGDPALLGNRR